MKDKHETRSFALGAIQCRLGEVEYRSPTSLVAYAKNPRKHPENQMVKLMGSIAEFGIPLPILIDVNDVIIAGEARVNAAVRLGLSEIPVIVATAWSPAKVRAYRIVDNRLGDLSAFDEQELALEIAAIIELDETPIEVLGWETAEIDLLLAGEDDTGAADPADELPIARKTTVSAPGDMWLLGPHRLLCGSSLDADNGNQLMDGKAAAMVISDAPFNVPVHGHVCGLGKVKHDEFQFASGEMSKAEFTAFLTDVIGRMADQLKDGGILDLFMDHRHMGEMIAALEANSLTHLNLCIWNKINGGMGSLYRSKHELVFVAKKGKAPHTNNVELGKHGRYRTNVWDYAGANSFGKNRAADLADHPTVKPVALVADAIRDVTHPGEIVIDGFMGSGTTILAAERTKRIAYGIEIEPTYIDVAIRRWEAVTRKQAILASTGQDFASLAAARVGSAHDDQRQSVAA